MSKIESFRAVILLWPRHADLAADLGRGCTAAMVNKWAQRDSIPGAWWSALLRTARARAAGLDARLFMRLAARQLEVA